ncbi:MAG: 3-hydroxyacyl-CoA dehydrogenase, partial [Firmicutes bacterium]|nr:3-hydroxyacyl-CoA dehydrogenase [Bacillota bacterium]
MELNKVTIIGGGVLGSQIGLMAAYVGKDVTFWLRSEGSVERTLPKLKRYGELMITDLLTAKALIGSPMGKFVYPKGLIRDWESATAESIDKLV